MGTLTPVEEALKAGISRSLREMRMMRGLSQDALATAAGLTRSAIANIETGRQLVSLVVLYRLAQALGVQPASLLPPLEEAPTKLPLPPVSPEQEAWVRTIAAAVGVREG